MSYLVAEIIDDIIRKVIVDKKVAEINLSATYIMTENGPKRKIGAGIYVGKKNKIETMYAKPFAQAVIGSAKRPTLKSKFIDC